MSGETWNEITYKAAEATIAGASGGAGPTAAQVGAVNETAPANDTASSGLNGRLQRIAQRITSLIALIPASLGAKLSAASFSIVGATDAVFAVTGGATAAATTSVASQTSAITILAANAARKGASVTNTDANALYLLRGVGTVSSTNYSVKIVTDGYYEVPFGSTAILTGLWAGDGSGVALVTEDT